MMRRSIPQYQAMPSIRARLTNAFLRRTTKSVWRPDLDIRQVRAHAAKMDARIGRKAPPVELRGPHLPEQREGS